MQQPSKPPRVRRKSRKRRDQDKPQARPSEGKRIRLTLQISGAIAAGALMTVVLMVILGIAGMGNIFFTFVGVMAGFGFAGAAIMFLITCWEVYRSRCPKCGKHGTFTKTGNKEFRAGESGLSLEYRCSDCGYTKHLFEKSMEGGERALGPDPYGPHNFDPF